MDLFKPFRGSRRKKTTRKKKRKTRQQRWPVLLGLAVVGLILGVGLLKWSHTRHGHAVLLSLGSHKMYGEVQVAVDSVLAVVLPGLSPGAVREPGDEDWPVPELGPGAVIRCRSVVVTADESWWQVQLRVAQAVSQVGASVLWGERLFPERLPASQKKPNEKRDLLRLDVGVPGRPTHTLVLSREGVRPNLHWGLVPSASRWTAFAAGDGPVVALIIDDWGNGKSDAAEALLALPVPLTMSVLPALPYSRHYSLQRTDLILPPGREAVAIVDQAAASHRQARLSAGCVVEVTTGALRRIRHRRREIMLHMPMEPQGFPGVNPGPHPVMVGMVQADALGLIDAALASLAHVTGLNNHMGSAATSDVATMHGFMAALRGRNLFFVDSMTSEGSVAYTEALSAGIPAVRNRIFLDSEQENEAAVVHNLDRLVQSARATGFAVGIGHPHPATAAALARRIPDLAGAGVRFVTVSELMALRDFRAAVAAGAGIE